MSVLNRAIGPKKPYFLRILRKCMPALLTQCWVSRSGDAKTLGAGEPRTYKYPWGQVGLDLLMPLGPGRSGLVNALGTGQVGTCQCPGAGQAWTYARSHKSLVNAHRLNRCGLVNVKGSEKISILFHPGPLSTCQLAYIPSTLNMPMPLGLDSLDKSTTLQHNQCVSPTLVKL